MAHLEVWVVSTGAEGIIWVVGAVVATLDAVLLAAALGRFRRAKLLLD